MTLSDVAAQLAEAGLPRNKRTLRRYCERGDLDCRKTENALHQPHYFVDAVSVETYIAQQKTLLASGRVLSGQDRAAPDAAAQSSIDPGKSVTMGDGIVPTPGPTRTSPDSTVVSRTETSGLLVEQLQARLTDKDEEIKFLRSELQHRRTTDMALHDVIAAFRANAYAQRLAAAPRAEATRHDVPDMSGQARPQPD